MQHTSGFLQSLPEPILVIPRSRTVADDPYTVQSEIAPDRWVNVSGYRSRQRAVQYAAQYRDRSRAKVRVVDNTR